MPHSNQEQDNTSSHLFPPSTDRMQCRFCRRFLGRGASLIAHLVKNPLQCRRPPFDSWVGKIRWRRDRLPTPVFLGFSYGSAGKESACIVGDLSSIPGLGRSPGEGKGYPVQYSGLENSMDYIVSGVTKSRTRLRGFHLEERGIEHQRKVSPHILESRDCICSSLLPQYLVPSLACIDFLR